MASTAWRTASLAVSMISSRRNWGTKPRSSGRRTEGTTEDEEGGMDMVLADLNDATEEMPNASVAIWK